MALQWRGFAGGENDFIVCACEKWRVMRARGQCLGGIFRATMTVLTSVWRRKGSACRSAAMAYAASSSRRERASIIRTNACGLMRRRRKIGDTQHLFTTCLHAPLIDLKIVIGVAINARRRPPRRPAKSAQNRRGRALRRIGRLDVVVLAAVAAAGAAGRRPRKEILPSWRRQFRPHALA